MNMADTKIYIVSHKPFEWKPKEGYVVLGVGNKQSFVDVHDNTLNNISQKNKNYCELTALYWIWKNGNHEIEGLVHYRRFFSNNIISSSPSFYITPHQAEKILSKYDFITTRLYHFKKTIFENRESFCYKEDLLKLRNTIKPISPVYISTYDMVMSGHRSFLCNMFITHSKLLDKYCKWLFSILFALEKRIDSSNYEDNWARLYEYMGEVLLTVFIFQNNLTFKPFSVVLPEKSFMKRLKDKFSHGFFK